MLVSAATVGLRKNESQPDCFILKTQECRDCGEAWTLTHLLEYFMMNQLCSMGSCHVEGSQEMRNYATVNTENVNRAKHKSCEYHFMAEC